MKKKTLNRTVHVIFVYGQLEHFVRLQMYAFRVSQSFYGKQSENKILYTSLFVVVFFVLH